MSRGFSAIGVYHPKTAHNIGTLLRSATLYDAAFVFTVGARYTRQASDTPNTPKHTPLFHFADLADLKAHLPWSSPLIGVELDERAVALNRFGHPERAVYLLGAEDRGLPVSVLADCHGVVQIPTPNPQSMNVAVAGSIVLHDRYVRGTTARPMLRSVAS